MNGKNGKYLALSSEGVWLGSNGLKTHFHIQETACPCCGLDEIDVRLIDKLELLRLAVGESIFVSSCCRCYNHNKEIGGSKTSAHLPITQACDIYIKSNNLYKLYNHAIEIGFNGVGLYYTNKGFQFIHVDIKNRKTEYLYWYKIKNQPYKYTLNPNLNWIKYIENIPERC